MKTTFHKTERHGHVDLFYIGSCRVSLLPEPPEKPPVHTCADEGCSHEEHTLESTTSDEVKEYKFAKIFVRQGFKTHMIQIPSDITLDKDTFINIFTCPYEELPEYLTTGSTTEQWLAELREEYLGSLDPLESTE